MKNSTELAIVSGLCGFGSGLISLWSYYQWNHREEQREKSLSTSSSSCSSSSNEMFHWNPLDERRGLGDLILKVNHIAITVADVGRSIGFYVDILGLQQIRRPQFDRHGAWLTMGNIELHLIKGIPVLPPVDNLQVGHISFETIDIDGILKKLREMKIPYRQNLSVSHASKKSGIVQYFINDPDGYFIEICNCDVLMDFSFKRNYELYDHVDYDEGISMGHVAFDVAQAVSHWRRKVAKEREQHLDDLLKPILRAKKVNEKKFRNLCQRRVTYGDIMQGFDDHEIKEALLRTRNDVPLAVRLLTEKRNGKAFFQPPSFMENGHLTKPEGFVVDLHEYH